MQNVTVVKLPDVRVQLNHTDLQVTNASLGLPVLLVRCKPGPWHCCQVFGAKVILLAR